MAKPLEAVTAITVVLSVKGNTIDFDPKLFGFMDKKDGIIILSDDIEVDAYQKIGITGKERLRLDLNEGVKNYLDHHHGMMFGPS